MTGRCELCGGPIETGEWRRCRRCRLDYGVAQHEATHLVTNRKDSSMPTRVRIGPNESHTVEVISDTELVATYMGGGAPGQPEDVEVTTTKGSALAVGAFTPTARPPAGPTIEAVTPDAGPGGTRVTIRGSGFEA